MNDHTLALLDLLAKGTAVLLLGFGCISFMRRLSAAHRSLAWLAVFGALLLLPLAIFVRPVWTVDVPVVKQRVQLAGDPVPLVVEKSGTEDIAPAPTSESVAAPAWTVWQWLAAFYVSGVALVLGFRLIGSWQLGWLKRQHAREFDGEARVRQMVRALCDRHGIRRNIRVLQSDRAIVPMTWGVFNPVLMMPSACSDWTDDDLRAALEHEMAHIRHCDAARRWLATFVCALWWPHPVVWIAGKSWRLEQERACDDAVVRSGSNAARYAAQLLDAAKSMRLGRFESAAALVMAMPSGLETRLRSVVGSNVNRAAAGRAAFWITAAAGLFVVTICAVCQAQTEASPNSDGPMIYITTKFIEAPAVDVAVRLPALKKAMEGSPVILSDREFQVLLRQLSQTKGVDLMSTPSVTTRSGQKATIQVAREFAYPTEFKEEDGHFVPTTFEMMPAGVTVELIPSIQANGVINISPATATVSEFLGFRAGGRENLKDAGKGTWRFDESKEFAGRAITEQAEVKKGEVSKPVFFTEKWSGDVSLKPGESQVVCLKSEKSAGGKDARRVWCFISATKVKPDSVKSSQSAAPVKADKPWVTVLGEVKRQGRYDFKAGMTLNDLIALGQAFSDREEIKLAMVTRGSGEAMRSLNLRLPKDGGTLLMPGDSVLVSTVDSMASDQAVSPIVRRASQIIFPQVVFRDAKLREALDFLRVKSKELDPDKVGINIVLREGAPNDARITLDLRDVPLLKVLRYVTELSGTKFVIEPYAVIVRTVVAGGEGDEMLTRVYAVPSTLLGTEKSAKNWLALQGVVFPEGASAVFDPVVSRLIVKNTIPELRTVEAVVEQHGVKIPEPPMPAIVKRAQAIIIPRIEFSGATIDEAVEFLQVKAKQLDPDKKGVNIVLKNPEPKSAAQLTLSLKDVPLWEALRYVSELAGMRLEAGESAIVIRPWFAPAGKK